MKFTKIKTPDSPRNIIRLPRMGKIRLGIKVESKTKIDKNGNPVIYPQECDYFVCPDEVKAKFGNEPKSLPVMLPVENEEMFLRQYYACYGGNQKLKCQGDGEIAERRVEGGIEKIACPSPEFCDFAKANACKARTDLMMVLPDINCGAVYQLSTGSVTSDIDIRSGIEMAKHLFGRCSWVPMMLIREEKKIPDPTTGKMTTHFPVKLYPIATVSEANAIREDTKRILAHQVNLSLPEPVIEGENDTSNEIIHEEIKEPHKTTDNAKFLKIMTELEAEIGKEGFYLILGQYGFEKVEYITVKEDQILVYAHLQEYVKERRKYG